MNTENMPSFDGKISLDHIILAAEMNLKFMKVAIDIKDFDAAEMYRHLASTHNNIVNIMIENALMPIADILKLPIIKTSTIPLTLNSIKEEIGEAIECTDLKIGNADDEEIIKSKITDSKTQSRVQKRKEEIEKVIKLSQIQDVDLFAFTKTLEKSIHAKLRNGETLTDEEEKLYYAKQVKDTIIGMIRNGGRMEAVELIQNYVFKYANYSNAQANMLVQAVKEHYKVKEPKDKPTVEFTKVEHLPDNTWLKIEYVIQKETETKEARIGLSFAIVNAKLGMMSPYGKKICDPSDILHYRPLFKYEEKRVADIINNL